MLDNPRGTLLPSIRQRSFFRTRRAFGIVFAASLLLGGCARLHREPEGKYVYVTAKQAYLRDRVAAVSNRTGEVQNGEKLRVLDRARRMIKVRSPRGEVGWIEETKTADQDLADQFDALKTKHSNDAVVASAATRDEVYLHISPGRETDKFFRLAEGEKLNLLARATVSKPSSPGASGSVAAPATAAKGGKGKAASGDAGVGSSFGPAPPVMEDWWLVRDGKGEIGWIYARMMDVDEPDALARYAEGQRIVGAYVLAHAEDPESNIVSNGQTVTSIPEYVTVLSPFKAGLPYDFNQLRVFSWNVKKHRYETAFRQRNIAGYLPVVVSTNTNPYEKGVLGTTPLPSFSYRVLSGDVPIPVPDSVTGAVTPSKTITKVYRLEGSNCYRIWPPDQATPLEAHPDPVAEKKDKHKH